MIVWYRYPNRTGIYVPRCGQCGRFKDELWSHVFFTGCYCRSCIQDKLYLNVWTIEEVNEAGLWFEKFDPSIREKVERC